MVNYCQVCYTDNPLTLPCNCHFCEECIFNWIAETNFTTLYSNIILIQCLNHKCKKQIPESWLYKNLTPTYTKPLNEIFFRKYTNTEKDIQKCPTCNNPGWIDLSTSCSDYLSCTLCDSRWFDPSLSSIGFVYNSINYVKNLKENVLSDVSELNVLLTSKPCGHCGIKIYKTSGCDHMTCTSCKNSFCYNCMRQHGESYSDFQCGFKYIILISLFGLVAFMFIVKLIKSFDTLTYIICLSLKLLLVHIAYAMELGVLWLMWYISFYNKNYNNNDNNKCGTFRHRQVTRSNLRKLISVGAIVSIILSHAYLVNTYEIVAFWTKIILTELIMAGLLAIVYRKSQQRSQSRIQLKYS
jgi:hypothetical protein